MPDTSPPIQYNNSVSLEKREHIDGRMFSPSAGRNKAVIAQNLAELLPQNTKLLEIASGTGEHGAELIGVRPDISWQYSDIDAQSQDSQSAWAKYISPQNIATETTTAGLLAPLYLDMCAENWANGLGKFEAMFSANMVHIAPWEATLGLAAGAEKIISRKGTIWLYGPFLDGEASAPSNLDFDASLKRRNSAWGVRSIDSVKHIFAKHGFNGFSRRDLPKNNLLLGFSR